MSKYSNKKTELDGYTFDSKTEANRYAELMLAEKAGDISNLELQPKFLLEVNGKKIATYIADFRYIENGKTVVEDVKGVKTPVYRIKKKLTEALYDVKIIEV